MSSSPPSSSVTTFTPPSSTLQTPMSSSATREFGPGCNADNCLRAFDRGNGSAFCSVFTLGGPNAPALPTYATQCTGSTSARVSSACTCLNYYGSSTMSFSSMSPSPTTTSRSSSSSSTAVTKFTPLALLNCNSDNCLRAMKREGGVGATAFCSTFTTAVVTNPAALPTYQTQCTKNAISQISSACSCLPKATI
ncbi:hypothetical protein BGZ57DRAFT_986558 [Hyaloscypha finlandica]|nr:hypothetical protein BGZ57DRAFT_986558 [Hyaloscypha finlandica]